MKRYVKLRSIRMAPMPEYSSEGPDAETYLAKTVYELEPQTVPSGLLDADGDPIMCVYGSDPIGFYELKERE